MTVRKDFPLVSVVTINYNGYDDTCELIDSLKSLLIISNEIIVVDNNSNNNEGERLRLRYPDIRVIISQTNLGFAGGNNLGIKESCGEYILLINNDTIVVDNGIQFLVDRLKNNPCIGGVSPKIRFYKQPQHIQFAGYTELSPVTLRNELIGWDMPDNTRFQQASHTAYLHGAAMMIRREIVESVGLMPEVYFLYYEELDFSCMIKDAGYELWFEPRCIVFHKESKSSGVGSPFKLYYITRNRLLFTVRNRSGLYMLLSILYQCLVAFPFHSMKNMFLGRFSHARAQLKAVTDFFYLLLLDSSVMNKRMV